MSGNEGANHDFFAGMDTQAALKRQYLVSVLERVDHQLLEQRARQGSAAAFGTLIEGFDRDLRGVVWSVVQSNDATDDVMQVAYEKAFRSIRTFDGRSALKTWLHRICVRAAIDYLRYENRRRHADIDAIAESGPFSQFAASPTHAGRVEDQIEAEQLLADVDPVQRALLMMTLGLGYSFDEVATIMDMKRGTVASKVSRARAQLRLKESER